MDLDDPRRIAIGDEQPRRIRTDVDACAAHGAVGVEAKRGSAGLTRTPAKDSTGAIIVACRIQRSK
jgi:hypothetical protein